MADIRLHSSNITSLLLILLLNLVSGPQELLVLEIIAVHLNEKTTLASGHRQQMQVDCHEIIIIGLVDHWERRQTKFTLST